MFHRNLTRMMRLFLPLVNKMQPCTGRCCLGDASRFIWQEHHCISIYLTPTHPGLVPLPHCERYPTETSRFRKLLTPPRMELPQCYIEYDTFNFPFLHMIVVRIVKSRKKNETATLRSDYSKRRFDDERRHLSETFFRKIYIHVQFFGDSG
ncbi:uncharacterized protein LOC125501078 [Athalia rosae]|uniref:uncharacterized protein LOC125501078 n=1 Tax=Athalia rosae TaxID=37344 RepID=UPI0020336046|nr:uncharacterized protein LOC125501078 [Athalia rosae]